MLKIVANCPRFCGPRKVSEEYSGLNDHLPVSRTLNQPPCSGAAPKTFLPPPTSSFNEVKLFRPRSLSGVTPF